MRTRLGILKRRVSDFIFLKFGLITLSGYIVLYRQATSTRLCVIRSTNYRLRRYTFDHQVSRHPIALAAAKLLVGFIRR